MYTSMIKSNDDIFSQETIHPGAYLDFMSARVARGRESLNGAF